MKDPGVIYGEGTQTSLTLLAKVRRKDKDAWNRLVSLYTPLVYHWCKRARLQSADIEEVTQEVFMAVARNVEHFHRDQPGDSFRGWLRIIAQNRIMDHVPPPGGRGVGGSDAQWNLQQVECKTPFDEDSPDSVAIEKNILYIRAIELIETCYEPSTRRAFWLQIAGKAVKDIAAELKMSTSAVYTAKSKILKHLREEFHDLLDLTSQVSAPG